MSARLKTRSARSSDRSSTTTPRLFLSFHAVYVDVEQGRLDETEIDDVPQPRAGSSPSGKDDAFEPVLQRWDRSRHLAAQGVSFLLYGLLDVVVDGCFDAVQAFDDYYDAVGDSIFSEPLNPASSGTGSTCAAPCSLPPPAVPRAKPSAASCGESTPPCRGPVPLLARRLRPHPRISESSDPLRDLVSTIVETNRSPRDYQKNQIVKVTSGAAIIAVPALVTGYYGMNVPYPGSGNRLGCVSPRHSSWSCPAACTCALPTPDRQ